jgi:hypothetical protein
LNKAVEVDDDRDSLLALAHFYLEQANPQMAQSYADRAVKRATWQWDAITPLSQAVILWELGQQAAGLEKLRQAQYEHFWGPRAVAALEAMLAQG